MRYALLLLLVPALLATGCSIFLARSGSDLPDFESREELHAQLGPPTRTTTMADGTEVEEFRSRRKFKESVRSATMGMGLGMSFGLSELVCFPREVFFQAKRIVFGQVIRFEFQPDGYVPVSIDGRSLYKLRPTK